MNHIKVLLILAFFSLSGLAGAQTDTDLQHDKLIAMLNRIEAMYVDSVDTEHLVEVAIRAMLEDLDPHSVYIAKDELKSMNEPLNGNFEGIGIQFNILNDTIMVVSPISGGPSEKLGIQAGDKIVEIDGENVGGIGIKNSGVAKRLKGPKSTVVNVGIKRGKSKKLIHYDIERDKIPIFSVDAVYMATPTTGYIKVNRFSRSTMKELKEGMSTLSDQGMENLILDLQGNGGGYLNVAIAMADEFLSDNKLIVYTEGRSFPKKETFARVKGGFEHGKLIVLIDEGSASASEIVSGAVQDWDRGLIIGRRSFGKGLVQRPVELPDTSAVRLTVQKYFTPSGRCIQKSYEDGVEAYRQEKYERFESGELFSLDSLDLPDSLKFATKIRGREVYGGGGILPDIFVPIDTTYRTDLFAEVIRSGSTNSFVLNYLDKNRNEVLKKFEGKDDFITSFNTEDGLLDEFLTYIVEEKEIEIDDEQYAISKEAIKIRLKALMARNLFESSDFYQVVNVLNPSYMKALEVLRDGTYEKMDLAIKN